MIINQSVFDVGRCKRISSGFLDFPIEMPTANFNDLRTFTSEPRFSNFASNGDPAESDTDAESRSELVVVIAYLSLLSVMGTGGNSIVMYVFSSKRDQLISTLFILVLAIVDFSTCLVVIPYTVFMEYHDFHVRSDAVCKLYMFLVTSNVPFSSLIMVAIAIDRYLSICHPLANVLDPTRAKAIVVALAVFATVQGICVSLQFGVYELESVTGPGNVSVVASGFEEEEEENVSESRRLVNTGFCGETDMVVSRDFQWYYQKLHAAIYPTCVLTVIVLYSLIYRSVLTRRSLRWSQKSRHLAHVQSLSTAVVRPGLLAESPLVACHGRPDVIPTSGSTKVPERETMTKRKSESRRVFRNSGLLRRAGRMDAFRLANIRTAAMLFVVTLVFIITFMPAFFMALKIVPYNVVVFYLYFANNVANPVIYSFMNQNFRSNLEKLFCRTR